MLNTYGLRSINTDSFNANWYYSYPKSSRNVIVTFFRIHNLTLNILGYIPGVSAVSGCVRIGTGLAMCAVTLAFGKRNAERGLIIQHWYDEALLTGITQIARGALEAFVPFGSVVNAYLDGTATIYNAGKEFFAGFRPLYNGTGPHADPDYPLPFWLLHLA